MPELHSLDPSVRTVRAGIAMATEPGRRDATSSVARAFDVLELFSLGQPVLRIDDVADQLGYTRSTAYRYVRELCDAGLLVPSTGGRYALGPRVVELERLLRLTDPLYLAGSRVLPPLRRDDSILSLQNLYRERVLCIYAEGPEALEHAGRRVNVKRTRGTPYPLFRGAASLALLAWMPGDRTRNIFLRHAREIEKRGLGADWEGFRATLEAIRRRGYATSGGQLAPELFGVAVPVVAGAERRVVGSLLRIFLRDPRGGQDDAAESACAASLKAIAKQIGVEFLRASRDGESDQQRPRAGKAKQ